METRIAELKKKLDLIERDQLKLDKIIQSQEDDGNYDDGLYSAMDELEEKKNSLLMELEALESLN